MSPMPDRPAPMPDDLLRDWVAIQDAGRTPPLGDIVARLAREVLALREAARNVLSGYSPLVNGRSEALDALRTLLPEHKAPPA